MNRVEMGTDIVLTGVCGWCKDGCTLCKEKCEHCVERSVFISWSGRQRNMKSQKRGEDCVYCALCRDSGFEVNKDVYIAHCWG